MKSGKTLFGPVINSDLICVCFFKAPNLSSPGRPMLESVYDLLPKELQLQPPSTQTDPPTMSQKSGGEAAAPPSAALASGELPA